jgi:acylglycerol lipase
VRSFIDAGADIIATKAKLIKSPILYSHADTDPINSFKGCTEAYELTASTDKELKNWPGLFHECK